MSLTKAQNCRHCERSEAIFLLKIKHLEIATSLALLLMNSNTESPNLTVFARTARPKAVAGRGNLLVTTPGQGDCFAAAKAFAALTGWAPLAKTHETVHP